MSNRSPNIMLHMLDQITNYIVQPRGPHGFSADFEKSVLWIFGILEAYGSMMRYRSSLFNSPEWSTTDVDIQKSSALVSKEHDRSLFECISTFYSSTADIYAQ